MYQRAVRWSRERLLDRDIIYEALRLAISAWLSACMAENASNILLSLPQETRLPILKDLINKILTEVDYLVDNNKHKLAIEHLNMFIKLYHDNNLMSELKKLNSKQLSVVDLLMKRGINK